MQQAQKKRVAKEETEARKKGLGIRLLPLTQDDITQAANVTFAHKFDINRRNKRAAIHAASIFSNNLTEQSPQGVTPKSNHAEKLDLLAKRRKVDAAGIRDLVCGKFKPSSRRKGKRNMQFSLLKPSVKIKLA
jgi:coiled-coil domain-containing protein 130